MAVSRILFPEFLRATIIYLIKISPDADKPIGSHRPPLQFIWCDDTRRSTDRLSSSCFVLHRMGFFLPRELLRTR
jgi:hypothetical protein